MAITLRPTKEDEKIIERLKGVLDETTTTKALLTAAASYLVLRESFQDLSKQYAVVRDTLNELRDLERQKHDVCNQMDKILDAGEVQFDGKTPNQADQILTLCTRQYLQKGLYRWN